MRKIIELGEHSIWSDGLKSETWVIDAGANHGRFTSVCQSLFCIKPLLIEANPSLAKQLRDSGLKVVECALGAKEGTVAFHVGMNDEASSIQMPKGESSHLRIREEIQVKVETLPGIIREEKLSGIGLIKLDIEGAEVEVLESLASTAKELSPQWTVEFHDDPEFGLSTRAEVNSVLKSMSHHGFSVLIRNWPSRTNVLFADRQQLKIGILQWSYVKLRYQYLAYLWRKIRGI